MSIRRPNSFAEIRRFGKQPLSAEEREARASFALLWKPTIDRLAGMGWKSFHAGSVSQLYIEDGPSAKLAWVLASPSNEFIYVRLNYTSPETLKVMEAFFHGLTLQGYDGMRITTEKTKRASGVEWFLEARIGMRELFEGCSSSVAMENRLAGFIVGLVERAT